MFTRTSRMILAAFLIMPSMVFSKEIEKGSFTINAQTSATFGGSELDFDSGSTIDTSITEIQSSVAYYADDNIGIGVSAYYESSEAKVSTSTSKTTTSIFGPYVSYNISLNEKVSLVPSVFFGYANISSEITGSSDQTISGLGYGGGVALLYFTNEHVYIGTSITYQIFDLEDDLNNGASQSSLVGSFGFGILTN